MSHKNEPPRYAPRKLAAGCIVALYHALLTLSADANDGPMLRLPVPTSVEPRIVDVAADPNHNNGLLEQPETRLPWFGRRPWITNGPVVPEPMLFDMVRPLHAERGELEFNTLVIVPLNRRHARTSWAPEIELAIADGLALEFEVPFEDSDLESLKGAVQYTFGVGMDNRMIHGFHGIYEYFFDGDVSELTSLYLMGFRFDPTWSVKAMFGFRTTIEGETSDHFTELIQNVSVFADITDRVIVGVETNMSHELAGESRLLMVPQVHWQWNENLSLQYGGGLDFAADRTVPIFAFRAIVER